MSNLKDFLEGLTFPKSANIHNLCENFLNFTKITK